MLYLSTARGYYYVGGGSDPLSVSAPGHGFAVAQTSRGEEDAGVSHAALPIAGIAGTERLRFHFIFATEFFAGDANSGTHSDRGSYRIRASLFEDAKQSLGG